MRLNLKLDDKLMMLSIIFLSIFLASVGLIFGEVISSNIEPIVVISFLGYIITFTFFLYYNHKLTKENSDNKEGLTKIDRPYRISFLIGFFVFIIGIFGTLINFNFLFIALISAGFFVMIYSLIGWHDIFTNP